MSDGNECIRHLYIVFLINIFCTHSVTKHPILSYIINRLFIPESCQEQTFRYITKTVNQNLIELNNKPSSSVCISANEFLYFIIMNPIAALNIWDIPCIVPTVPI